MKAMDAGSAGKRKTITVHSTTIRRLPSQERIRTSRIGQEFECRRVKLLRARKNQVMKERELEEIAALADAQESTINGRTHERHKWDNT